ncbi:ThiF family adenylyltransferase [Phytoactinopolyspora halotolerans]|uniref:ThiF family adenylyltransferase n=1 Tax=Phytoactinopolyspora halotolerans TaxID=1981512 RepID=A0A6L9SII9_9ACTN|nr:ThiF family adenylyltransferase [Phytoactinopolyspora halotolerans]NEE04141.1 ThiF family adenylyltransferase [Phytoactinopolyspora halotolerans]
MRPQLHPALSFAWREPSTVQIGTTANQSHVFGGLSPIEATVLRAMDGNNDLPTLRDIAVAAGGRKDTVDRLLRLLTPVGAVVDHDATTSGSDTPREHHRPDLASLALVDRSPDGGLAAFAARGKRRVKVVGGGRVGASVARLLDAGGVGTVWADDQRLVTEADVAPGAHPHEAVGIARDRSLSEMLGHQGTVTTGVPGAPPPDIVVLDATGCADPTPYAAVFCRERIPHLVVKIVEVTGIVGPLVIPGESACLRCLDLHRTDRDPDWPTVLDQAGRYPPTTPPCDASLTAAVAGMAAGQVLAYLDGFEVCAVDATVEVELPYGLPRRRSWQPHPDCGCTWEHTAEWLT